MFSKMYENPPGCTVVLNATIPAMVRIFIDCKKTPLLSFLPTIREISFSSGKRRNGDSGNNFIKGDKSN
jgi:hypothetical protein